MFQIICNTIIIGILNYQHSTVKALLIYVAHISYKIIVINFFGVIIIIIIIIILMNNNNTKNHELLFILSISQLAFSF